MKNYKELNDSELYEFAKNTHQFYYDNLNFGKLDSKLVSNLCELAFCIEDWTDSNKKRTIEIFDWIKENIQLLDWRNPKVFVEIEGQIYFAINNHEIINWWKDDYDKVWLLENFNKHMKLYEFIYNDSAIYVVTDERFSIDRNSFSDNYGGLDIIALKALNVL